jgi:monomeric phenylalanine-4-hydroxylase
MQKVSVEQDYTMYNEEDHNTWLVMCKRQNKLKEATVCKAYLKGFHDLKLDITRIVRIDETSKLLESITGWTLTPVNGLIPTRDFFYMLINQVYPITISIRKPWEIDFSEQPDIFHDVCGHLPLLTNPDFVKFLNAYSIVALKYAGNDRAIEALGQLYWFTYEMGIIVEDGDFKAYGGAIITSEGESLNLQNNDVPKYPFDLGKIFRTPYNPFKLQKEYFYINSFNQLFNSLDTIEATLAEYLQSFEISKINITEKVSI